MNSIFTIGHSDHPIDRFIELLKQSGITAIADVRSSPYSRLHPQFNREPLRDALRAANISYVFLGAELGARPADRSCYRNGVAEYDRIAATDLFKQGLDRALNGSTTQAIALMCAEKEPLDCHRTVLVARNLKARGARIKHILADGRIEDHEETESRLLRMTDQETADMFSGDPLEKAYDIRGGEICFREQPPAKQA